MRMGCVLALLLTASLARAQDDWALTRPPAPARQLARQAELAAARALALDGRHAEAAAAFRGLAAKLLGSRTALLRESAREWLAAGQPAAAIEVLGALPGDPLEREAYRRAGRGVELAERDERGKRWAAAGDEWERAGDDVRALAAYERAGDAGSRLRLLQKLGRTLDAETLAEAMTRRAPGEPGPLLALAELRRAAGKREEALALLAHAQPRSLALHRALRTLYAAWGERGLEERELARLVELEPAEPAHRLALADLMLARGDRERARAELLRAAALDGSAAREAYAAELLADRDLLAEALEHVARARALAPAGYRELEASLLERAGRLSDAERAYTQLLATERAGEARRRIAGLWRRLGTLDAHIAALRTRDDLESLRMLAALYARDPRKLGEQRALLERVLVAAPDDREARRALAHAHREAGDLHAAIELAPRVLEVDEALELARAAPRDPALPTLLSYLSSQATARVWAELAAIYVLRGDAREAREAFQRATALEPGADDVRLAWAEFERSLGQPVEAELSALLAHGRSEEVLLRAAALLGREQARPALLAGAHQQAQRRVLLTLGEPLPSAVLRSALLDGDERERAQALAQLGERPELSSALLALVARADRTLAERTAALLALPVTPALRALYPSLPRPLRAKLLLRLAHDPASRPLLERERGARDPGIRAAAERALASDDALARALFSGRADERAAAVDALRGRDAWDAITRAAQANPTQLVPYGPGLAPAALIEAGGCPARERVVAFSAALVPVLAQGGDVALLVHAGGVRPDSLRRLDRAQLHALTVELAARAELPPGAAEALRQERPLRDWPERMWATRALGAADARETMALVRTLPASHTRTDACGSARKAAN